MKRRERKLTKTISRFGWRISERRRFVNSSSVVPSKRFGFVTGVEDLRLLLTIVGWDDGEEEIGEVFFVKIVDIDGRGEDEGDGETTFIIGEIIVFLEGDDDERISEFVLICSWDFCSFSIVDIVSRLSDSRNFDRNASATSSEPNLLFKALNRKKIKDQKRSFLTLLTYSRLPPDSKFFLNVCINTPFTLSNASSKSSCVWLKNKTFKISKKIYKMKHTFQRLLVMSRRHPQAHD